MCSSCRGDRVSEVGVVVVVGVSSRGRVGVSSDGRVSGCLK